jgi:MFS transporter, YNFM family, putative membrane transport protein
MLAASMRATPAPGRARWALYLGTVAAYADMYITQPILPDLSREFGVGPARAGLTVSAVVLAIALASILYGPLADAAGHRRVMAASLGLLAVATLLCALPRTFAGLVALRGLQGLLVPGMTAVSVAYAGERFQRRDLAAAVGGIIAASVLGGLLSRVGAGWIAAHRGWRAAFAIYAAFTAAAAALVWRGLEGGGGRGGGLAAATRGLGRHLRDPPLLGAYLVGFGLFFGFIGVFTYLPYLLAGPPHRLTTGLVSSAYLVYAFGILVSPLAGRLSARAPPRRLVALGLAVAAGGMGLTLLRPLAAVVGGLVVLVVGMFTAQAVVPAFVNTTAREAKASASGLYLTAYYLGGTLGSAIPGLAWQAAGWPGVIATCVAALAVAALANASLCGLPPRTDL